MYVFFKLNIFYKNLLNIELLINFNYVFLILFNFV